MGYMDSLQNTEFTFQCMHAIAHCLHSCRRANALWNFLLLFRTAGITQDTIFFHAILNLRHLKQAVAKIIRSVRLYKLVIYPIS